MYVYVCLVFVTIYVCVTVLSVVSDLAGPVVLVLLVCYIPVRPVRLHG